MIKFIRQAIENNPKIIYYFYIINKKNSMIIIDKD